MHKNKKMIYFFFIVVILCFSYVYFAMPDDLTGEAWYSGFRRPKIPSIKPGTSVIPETQPGRLVAYYSFDDATATDIARGYNGELKNDINCGINGVKGKACGFDGVDDYINMPSFVDLSKTDFTVSWWTKTDVLGGTGGTSSQFMFSFGKGVSRYWPANLMAQWSHGTSKLLRFAVPTLEPNRAVSLYTSNKGLEPNKWYHFAIRVNREKGLFEVFKDGKLWLTKTDSSLSSSANLAGGYYDIGKLHGAKTGLLKGAIDEFKIYNYAIPDSSVYYEYESAKPKLQQPTGVFKDGDAYIGEDLSNPDWVWNIRKLYGGTIRLGIENDFVKNDYSDYPPGIGECYKLPNDHLQICLDSLTVADYLTTTIEYAVGEDLSDIGQTTSEDVIMISAPGDDRFRMVGSGKSTSKVYVGMKDATTGFIAYKDVNQNPMIQLYNTFTTTTSGTEFMLMDYGESGNLRFSTNLDNGMAYIHLDSGPSDEELIIEFNENGQEIISLGQTSSKEEAHELRYRGPAISGEALLGIKDEDHRMAYGTIIKNPKLNGASGKVTLEIPREQVQAKIIWKDVKGNGGVISIIYLTAGLGGSNKIITGEVLDFGTNSPSIETSLTSSEDDYEHGVFMECNKYAIKYDYDYYFDIGATRKLTFLGREMNVTIINENTIKVE